MTVLSELGEPVDVFVPANQVPKPLFVGLKLECSLLVINARIEAREVAFCKEEKAVEQSLEKFRTVLGLPTDTDPQIEAVAMPDLGALLGAFGCGSDDLDFGLTEGPMGHRGSLADILDELVVPVKARPSLSRSGSDDVLLSEKGFELFSRGMVGAF